jgi:cell wall-associated NlpC family hydrolase
VRIEAQLPNLAASLMTMAAHSAPREAGAVLVTGHALKILPNQAAVPAEQFCLGSLSDLESEHGQITAIVHTHPEDQPPSAVDVATCRATMLPWIIAGPNRLWVIHPEAQPYAGREFVYGVQDCFTLVGDYFAQEHGVFLPWFERPDPSWWDDPKAVNPYLAHAQEVGFQLLPWAEVGIEGLAVGDVILARVAAKQTNHAAVYLGGGNILHHLWGYLSRIEQFDGRSQRFTTHVARYIGK